MIAVHFIAMAPSLILAALTPAKVSDVETKTSAMPALKRPGVIYVKSFSIRTTASKSEDSAGGGRPHLLGMLRGGEENTVVSRHREEQHEDAFAKLPGLLQKALIDDLSKSVARAASGDGAHASPATWIITGEFVDVDTGNRALQAGVGFWRRTKSVGGAGEGVCSF